MTTTPTNPEDKSPRERGRQTCRAAYMADLLEHLQAGAAKRSTGEIADLWRDAGGKGWLNKLWGASEGTRPRDLLLLALQQGAARPSKSLQRVTLDGEEFMLPGDIANEFLAADDSSPERTRIAVRGIAAMHGRVVELEEGIRLAQDELDGAAEEDSLDRRDQAMREANRQLARVR